MTTIEHVQVERLIPYARNSRTHSDMQIGQIAASIKEFGFTNPVLIDGEDMIIAGHGRVMAASKLRLNDVPCIRLAYLTEAQKKAYIIADNKIALNAGWDNEMLRIELDELKSMDFDLDLIGFDDEELAEIFSSPEVISEGLTDEDSVPEVPIEPTTKLGDIWLCGDHRVMCGDGTDINAVEKLINGRAVDVWLTDPPYNVEYEGRTNKKLTIKNDAMANDEFRSFLRESYAAADNVMKAGAVFYIWHANKESYNFQGAALDIGWTVRQHLVWKKNTLVMGQQDYHYKHEPCIYGWKDGAAHLWAADRKQTTIIEFDRPTKSVVHPTMKPVALFEYMLLNNTKGGDIVLDSFGGSGTTMLAAEKNGRHSRLMELDPKYCDVIIKRWQDFTGKSATLESSGETFNSLENVSL